MFVCMCVVNVNVDVEIDIDRWMYDFWYLDDYGS